MSELRNELRPGYKKQTEVGVIPDRVSQTLTGRIRELAERYATPLPQIVDEVAVLAARVDRHLEKMGMRA